MSSTNSHATDSVSGAQMLLTELAGSGLPPAYAKLYSQHTRLSSHQSGLTGWRDDEAEQRLHDAARLISASLTVRDQQDIGWREGLRRAAELLEWLSHDELNVDNVPTKLLAASAYQIAGYPARSTGLLDHSGEQGEQSRILRSLLKADFRSLLRVLVDYWSQRSSQPTSTERQLRWQNPNELAQDITELITTEVARSLGVVCAAIRWGDDLRLSRAISKLGMVADVVLHGTDPYSWMLAKLVSVVVQVQMDASLRSSLNDLSTVAPDSGKNALERYLRNNYMSSRTLAWPSQRKGIARLGEQRSFALCTPTGSGKTAVAEVAVLHSLFMQPDQPPDPGTTLTSNEPIALYLVPSRALAFEVEGKLEHVFRRLGQRVLVTGLYGGFDWGPTDAWLTADDKTVLICTYEKAEALIRFVGPLFLDRVRIVVVDEAHRVQFDDNYESLYRNENRPLRLESLGTRLFSDAQARGSRVIALSAVAGGIDSVLSSWITGSIDSDPVTTDYHSTRQLIGFIDCGINGETSIQYDLLDGADLRFSPDGSGAQKPFVPNPFPRCPDADSWRKEGAEKRIRPHLFWSAIHLAQPDEAGRQRGVLISVTQSPGGYADDFLKLLGTVWSTLDLPRFFLEPTDAHKQELWTKCLRACRDYFGEDSREYELLERGIVLHHGKMPGSLGRLLVRAIRERVVNLVVATSTLSEGVNLPFETVLIPSLRRAKNPISAREFGNLVGRAGRPGYGTEGRSLVLLPQTFGGDQHRDQVAKARQRYDGIIHQIRQSSITDEQAIAVSPLAVLLSQLNALWQRVSGTNSDHAFVDWLEQTAPIEWDLSQSGEDHKNLIAALDTLDGVVLSTIVEFERLSQQELSANEMEDELRRIWQHTYARFASAEEQRLREHYILRGNALRNRIYPEQTHRRRLYRTGLAPRDGSKLIEVYPALREHLENGFTYTSWSAESQFNYIRDTVKKLSVVQQFKPEAKAGSSIVDWSNVLRWWLDPENAPVNPARKQISNWHDFVSKSFIYRFNWGMGSVIALAFDQIYDEAVRSPNLQDWPNTGLPWITFWIKELVTWGTLDPVVTQLLTYDLAASRSDARLMSQSYYASKTGVDANEMLNATSIKRWIDELLVSAPIVSSEGPPLKIRVNLNRDFGGFSNKRWRVVPINTTEKIQWLDPAGYALGWSDGIEGWQSAWLDHYDFFLDPSSRVVEHQPYV